MKFLLFLLVTFLLNFELSGISTAFASRPLVGGAWVQLYSSPNFFAEREKLASVWGPNLPMGVQVKVVEIYGRWLFAVPEPLKRMKKKDYAKPGWIYNRMLTLPGDTPIRNLASRTSLSWIEYHTTKYWDEISGAPGGKNLATMQFLNSLIIGNATMDELRRLDEAGSTASNFWERLFALGKFEIFIDNALAKPVDKSNLGFSGAHLSFLRVESKKAAVARAIRAQKIEQKRLKPPVFPEINNGIINAIFGRYFFASRALLPSLSHEEVDAHLYLQSVAMRALSGCSPKVKEYWDNRPWRIFRVNGMKGINGAHDSSWFNFWLPGDQILLSSEALRQIKDEAELAFVLARNFIHIARLAPKDHSFSKDWKKEFKGYTSKFEQYLKELHYVKFNPKLDVGSEISTDMEATKCIAQQDYFYGAGLKLLKRAYSIRHIPEMENFWAMSMGPEYRIKEFGRRLESDLASGKVPSGSILNEKRFNAARKIWNL